MIKCQNRVALRKRRFRYTEDKTQYRDPSIMERKRILLTSIGNISHMIKNLRTSLYYIKGYLEDPFNCDRVVSINYCYQQGPIFMAELKRLEAIREDLYKCLTISLDSSRITDNHQ